MMPRAEIRKCHKRRTVVYRDAVSKGAGQRQLILLFISAMQIEKEVSSGLDCVLAFVHGELFFNPPLRNVGLLKQHLQQSLIFLLQPLSFLYFSCLDCLDILNLGFLCRPYFSSKTCNIKDIHLLR